MRVVITGGGTGGHIYPGLGIEAALRADAAARGERYKAVFIGNRKGLEASIVPQTGVPTAFVPAAPLARRDPFSFVAGLGLNLAGIGVATAALNRFRPDVVIASGGYACFPVVAAASLLRMTRRINPLIALLEPNATPGLTNRVLAPLVDEVWCAPWTASTGSKHNVVTGIPVRPQFKALPPKPRARESLSIDPHATVVVVIGGSQGSRSINQTVLSMITEHDLPHEWWILHISGRRDAATMEAGMLSTKRPGNRFTLLPYLDDLWTAYSAADLVIARAGASTLGELAVTGRPAILVPYPFAADNHQMANAQAFSDSGAAKVLADGMLTGDNLFRALSNALEPDTLASMTKAAASLAPADAAAMIVRRVQALRDERTQT